MLALSTTEHENGQTIPLSQEGKGPSGPGVDCGFRDGPTPALRATPPRIGFCSRRD